MDAGAVAESQIVGHGDGIAPGSKRHHHVFGFRILVRTVVSRRRHLSIPRGAMEVEHEPLRGRPRQNEESAQGYRLPVGVDRRISNPIELDWTQWRWHVEAVLL